LNGGWLKRGEKVSFPKLIEISARFDIDPIDLCTSPPVGPQIDAISQPGSAASRSNRRTTPRMTLNQRKDLGLALIIQLNDSGPPPPLWKLAQQFGKSRSTLKYWYPNLCASICDRRANVHETNVRAAKQQRKSIVGDIVKSLQSKGIHPARREVDARLHGHGLALARPEVFAYYRRCLKK
jgi:hypothetical protein